MIEKIICKLLGHNWRIVKFGFVVCARCGKEARITDEMNEEIENE